METNQTDQQQEEAKQVDNSQNITTTTSPDTDKKDDDYLQMGPPSRRSPRLAKKAQTQVPLKEPEDSDSDIIDGTTTNDDDERDSWEIQFIKIKQSDPNFEWNEDIEQYIYNGYSRHTIKDKLNNSNTFDITDYDNYITKRINRAKEKDDRDCAELLQAEQEALTENYNIYKQKLDKAKDKLASYAARNHINQDKLNEWSDYYNSMRACYLEAAGRVPSFERDPICVFTDSISIDSLTSNTVSAETFWRAATGRTLKQQSPKPRIRPHVTFAPQQLQDPKPLDQSTAITQVADILQKSGLSDDASNQLLARITQVNDITTTTIDNKGHKQAKQAHQQLLQGTLPTPPGLSRFATNGPKRRKLSSLDKSREKTFQSIRNKANEQV